MGGAVGTVAKKAVEIAATPYTATTQMAVAAAKGEGLNKSIFKPISSAASNTRDIVSNTTAALDEAGIVAAPSSPASIVAADPAIAAAEAAKKKEAARRQAEIDILTDRPGRGGTILTDNYNYKT